MAPVGEKVELVNSVATVLISLAINDFLFVCGESLNQNRPKMEVSFFLSAKYQLINFLIFITSKILVISVLFRFVACSQLT